MIGAGLAGLAAAVTLIQAGRDVHVLEARDRVGGRVYTVRAPFDDGLYAEGGAEYVGASHLILRRFLSAYNVRLEPRPNEPRLFSFLGQRWKGHSLGDGSASFRRDVARIARAGQALAQEIPDPTAPWTAPAATELDAQSFEQWLGRLDLHPVTRAYQRLWTAIDYGIDPPRLSLLQYARDERLYHAEPWPWNERPVGGIDQLPRAMAAELGDRVQLSAPAMAIDHSATCVAVQYTQDGASRQIEARRAILAVPFTVLRTLPITPQLESERHEAIKGLRYGHVLKVLLQFRRRLWNDDGLSGGAVTDLPFQTVWHATRGQPGERGILGIYTAGRAGASLATLPEEQRIRRCLEQLDQVYPRASAEFERGVSVVWDADPACLGAYSYFAPGELTRYGPLLAQPEGRLHFAGEHTDPWQATMNGALSSGVRAAREIMNEEL